MNLNKQNADLATDKIDWFLAKKGSQLVMAFLLVVILVMGIMLVKSEFSDKKRYQELEKKVNDCSDTQLQNTQLIIDIEKMKSDFILMNAIYEDDPMARWVTGIDGRVLRVNKAYVEKYLIPRGYKAIDILFTDGSHIFGEEEARKFVENNKRVLSEKRAITFEEIETTTKYPVLVGNYIFAVGGTEYEVFK